MLGLATPRDAFFNSLAKFAVPTLVVSSLDSYIEPQTPRSATTQLTDSVGWTSPLQPPGLSERNLACLKVFVSSALFLAGTLGQSWFGVLEVLQNADYVLTHKGANQSAQPRRSSGTLQANRSSSNVGGMTLPARHPLLSDLDPDTMQNGIQRLFDASKNLEDFAFRDFVNALCRLSGEMIGMQTASLPVVESEESLEESGLTTPTPKTEVSNRRRVSGIHIPRTLVCACVLWFRQKLNGVIDSIILAHWRLWYFQTHRGGHAQHPPINLSISGYCMGYHYDASSFCDTPPSCPSTNSNTSSSCSR
jgi:hypothetical protein